MPPRQPSSNPRNNRRRPSPGMPGGWLWLILVATVLVMLFVVNYDSGTAIDYSDFWALVQNKNVKRVVFMGNDRILGEIQDRGDVFLRSGEDDGLGRAPLEDIR